MKKTIAVFFTTILFLAGCGMSNKSIGIHSSKESTDNSSPVSLSSTSISETRSHTNIEESSELYAANSSTIEEEVVLLSPADIDIELLKKELPVLHIMCGNDLSGLSDTQLINLDNDDDLQQKLVVTMILVECANPIYDELALPGVPIVSVAERSMHLIGIDVTQLETSKNHLLPEHPDQYIWPGIGFYGSYSIDDFDAQSDETNVMICTYALSYRGIAEDGTDIHESWNVVTKFQLMNDGAKTFYRFIDCVAQ